MGGHLMTNQERLVRVESILRRQNSGKLSKWDASAEMDALLTQGDGQLCFYSDSTNMTAPWDVDLMLMPCPDGSPSNTGIYARGPKRGIIVTVPDGAVPTCAPAVLEHFKIGAAHRPLTQ